MQQVGDLVYLEIIRFHACDYISNSHGMNTTLAGMVVIGWKWSKMVENGLGFRGSKAGNCVFPKRAIEADGVASAGDFT